MTDIELDCMMRRVLLDAVKLKWEDEESGAKPAFEASARYQRQVTAMLTDPLGWARKRARPVWKKALQRIAVVLLVFSLSFGSLMAVSPTVRAAVVRWVTEWYETHITYRYSGEPIAGEMPRYEITELPVGYVEDEARRVECPSYVRIGYRNENDENAQFIYLAYIYMQQGSASDYVIEDAVVLPVTVNGMKAQLYLARNPELSDSTVTWIDPDKNLQFDVHAAFDKDTILHIAESVSLVKPEK